MKNILVIGSTGQIGSELTMKLRSIYGNDHVVAGYITGQEPTGILLESGPSALCDVTDGEAIAAVVKQYNIDAIYNLAALLSVVAERKPLLAWKIGIDGLLKVLEVARENNCAVFTPSSIGSSGNAGRQDAAGYHTTAPHDLRCEQGDDRVAQRLLSSQVRHGHTQRTLPGFDLQRNASGWRHDRLRCRHLL